MRNLSVLLLAASALAGCNLAPKHVRPALPTAPDFPAAYAGDARIGQRASEVGWRTFLADPRLEALIAQALKRNRDLAVAVAQIEEARGQYRIQNADRLPTLGLSADATRTRTNGSSFGSAAPTPTPTPTPGGPPASGGSGSFTFDRYSVGVGVTSFELDFWGRVRNLSEAARAQYLATAQAERAFRLSLIRDVAATYLALREADERIALAVATVKSRNEGVRIAKLRLDAGVTSALDFRQAETLLTQAETALAALRQSKAQNENFLSVLIGGPVDGVLPDALPLAKQASAVTLTAGLPSDLLNARPDILSAEENLRAARANVGAARAAFFPTISLTGSLGFASSQLSNLFTSGGFNYSIGPSLSLPILDFGRTKGNLTVARARETIQVATYEKTVQTAFQEVSDALAGRRFLADQVTAQERGTLATRQIAEIARTRYREGVANYLEVLDAERNLFDAEQALIQVRRSQADNMVTLYVALGGGLVEGQ